MCFCECIHILGTCSTWPHTHQVLCYLLHVYWNTTHVLHIYKYYTCTCMYSTIDMYWFPFFCWIITKIDISCNIACCLSISMDLLPTCLFLPAYAYLSLLASCLCLAVSTLPAHMMHHLHLYMYLQSHTINRTTLEV